MTGSQLGSRTFAVELKNFKRLFPSPPFPEPLTVSAGREARKILPRSSAARRSQVPAWRKAKSSKGPRDFIYEDLRGPTRHLQIHILSTVQRSLRDAAQGILVYGQGRTPERVRLRIAV